MTVLLTNGVPETAEDGGRVTRDVLCEFWKSVFEKCSLGSSLKVRCLRHGFGELDLQSVVKIIVFGKCWIFPYSAFNCILFKTLKSNLL